MIPGLAGGGVVIAIVTELTVVIALAVTEGSLVAAAVIVTVAGLAGAVQTVVTPLAVCDGLNEPQGDGVHVQSTPLLRVSFDTVAEITDV